MPIQDLTQAFEITLNTDGLGNPILQSITDESHTVLDSTIVLAQIPDESNRVQISGKYEIDISSDLTATSMFKVDYDVGLVFFNSGCEGYAVNVLSYSGRGIKQMYASRLKIEDSSSYYVSTEAESAFKEVMSAIAVLSAVVAAL